jgi:hypothetical protein
MGFDEAGDFRVSLNASQLIYTNVEKKLSPAGTEGFQIWLKTPGALSDGEETEIQSRLGDFEERKDATANESLSERHLFFTLPSGRAVIARSVPLAGNDKFNRGGRFYAHALILESAEFRKIENDPFAVFDQVRFQSSVEDGLASGDAEKGEIPPLSLEVWTPDRSERPVPSEKLPAILPALLKACQREKPALIGVPAAPGQVLALARQLLAWLPASLRQACSFDTLSSGRNLTQLPFAIAGLPAAGPPRRYLNLLQFDPLRHSFTQPPPISTASSFDQWLTAQSKRSDQPPPLPRNESAYQLATCLDTGRIDPAALEGVDKTLFEEIACTDAGVPKLEKLLRIRLQSDAGEIVAPLLFAHGYNWLRSRGLDGLCKLAEPIDPALILRWLFAIYEQRSREEIRREVEVPALKEVLEKTKNVEGEGAALRKQMVLILYRWAYRWSHLARSMCDSKMIPDEVFQWFVGWALGTMPIRATLGSGTTSQGGWCGPEVSCENKEDADECQKLFAAILGKDPKVVGDESGEVGGERHLPPDRWSWVLHYLLNLAH